MKYTKEQIEHFERGRVWIQKHISQKIDKEQFESWVQSFGCMNFTYEQVLEAIKIVGYKNYTNKQEYTRPVNYFDFLDSSSSYIDFDEVRKQKREQYELIIKVLETYGITEEDFKEKIKNFNKEK